MDRIYMCKCISIYLSIYYMPYYSYAFSYEYTCIFRILSSLLLIITIIKIYKAHNFTDKNAIYMALCIYRH